MQLKIEDDNYGVTRQALTKAMIENFEIHIVLSLGQLLIGLMFSAIWIRVFTVRINFLLC